MGKKAYIKEASKELGLTIYQTRRMIREGRLPVISSGNRYILDLTLCEEYLRKEAFENIKPVVINSNQNGVLRRINE